VTTRPLVDPKSFELAEYFLPDDASEQRKWDLAEIIQTTVETWMVYLDNPRAEDTSHVSCENHSV
jgi:hypothetical protein